jgi:RND family efflux transporter MFP subunit
MERTRPPRISPELSVVTSVRVRIAPALLLGALVSFAGACHHKPAPVPPPQPVVVATVEQRDTPIYGEWVATLDGFVNAQIESRVAGYVIRQTYTEGSLVKKGAVLFEIDPRPFIAALAQAKAQLAQAEAQLRKATRDVNRDTPLAAEQAISQSELDTEIAAKEVAEAQVMAGKANVEQAALNLEFTRVTSLVTGIAGIARVQVGNLVGPTAVLTTVSQVDPIKAYITVSEQEYTDFHRRFPTEASVAAQRKKMPLQLILADGTLYERTGTVSFADREVNPATGAIRIAGLFANPNNLLRPGEYGRVRLSAKSQPGALLVPQRAVTELQGSFQVAVVGGDDKISIRPVTVGDRVGQLWIVTDGLKAGERVVVEGQMKVHDGSAVKPVPASPVTPSTGGG